MKLFLSFAAVLLIAGEGNGQTYVSSLDSLLSYATPKSISLQTGDIRMVQAKKAKLAAILSIPEVGGNVSGSYTNNTRLPVNLFPAEAFGGTPGTYKEIQTGIQYNTALNESLDIKLLNLKGWESLRLAKLNIAATASDNQLTLKTLHEDIAAAYYNILDLQEQVSSTRQNLVAADTLVFITTNRFEAGLVRQQDLNDALASRISTKKSLVQLQHLVRQQYLSLQVLTDIPLSDSLVLTEKITDDLPPGRPAVNTSNVSFTNSVLKEQMAQSTYKQQKYSLYPTLSFFQAYTNQQFSSDGKLLGNDARWIPSSYVGLRLNIPIPSSTAITQASKARHDYMIAQKNRKQQSLQAGLQTAQLITEFDKAVSELQATREIFFLYRESHEKNLLLYREGLLSLDQTLTSFNNMVNSHYNLISARVSVLAAKAKIDINNRMQ